MNIAVLEFAILLFASQSGAQPQPITADTVIESSVESSSPRLLSPLLEKSHSDGFLARGRRFQFVPDESGSYYVELISHYFDSYLILRDRSGSLIQEDNNSLLNCHARIQATFEKDHEYLIDAGALHDGIGSFSISVRRGTGVDYSNSDLPPPDQPNRVRGDNLRGSYRAQWTNLPGTLLEGESVIKVHQSSNKDIVRLLLKGPAATEERVKSEMERYQYVHIATHGFFEPESLTSIWESAQSESESLRRADETESKQLLGLLPGLMSGLVCAGVNSPNSEERDNGLLTAEEIGWLNLSNCQLAVLSACQTGIGTIRGGEGMIGLRRAFGQAGAKTIVSSLWSIGDESTKELMQEFYRKLWTEGRSKIDALRGAQLEMLKRQRQKYKGDSFPSTWGAFVLDGDWR